MPEPAVHRPVLLEEVLQALNVRPHGIYVDGTFGRGGHSAALLDRLGPDGRLIAIDKDPQAVRAAREHLAHDARFAIERGSFATLKATLGAHGVSQGVDGVVLDLGVSSPQLDDPQRGFSFTREGPLDMRMDPDSGRSAAQWLAGVEERELAEVLKTFGEERYARRIARAIVRARRVAPIETTLRLAEIIADAVPTREPGKHPATRTFQAIRIVVNHELEDLRAGLTASVQALRVGGRLAVICFHSLEDRIVKRFIRDQARGGDYPPDLPVTAGDFHPTLRPVGRAVHPGAAEIASNPRARSAVLRVAERVH